MKQIKDHRGGSNNPKVAHAQIRKQLLRVVNLEFIYFFSMLVLLFNFCFFVAINSPAPPLGGLKALGGAGRARGTRGGAGGAKSTKPECPLAFNKNKYLPLKI